MSTVKSSAENLTLNADGANNDIKFQSNGSEVASIDQGGVISSTGGTTHADNVKAKFGTGGDLEIFHDGSNSYIHDTGTGDLYLKGSAEVLIRSATNENMIKAVADGAVSIYHNNAKKFETTATGVTVTGAIGGATNLGKVLQVINAVDASETATSSTSFADTGLTAAITPSASSSKILVMIGLHFATVGSQGGVGSRLLRGSSVIRSASDKSDGHGAGETSHHEAWIAFSYLDSPNTTNATTYKMQAKTNISGQAVYTSVDNNVSTITLMEIGA